MRHYNQYKVVKVTIATEDGEVLDQFEVAHWRRELDENEHEDVEGIGSPMSNVGVIDRIERYVEPIRLNQHGFPVHENPAYPPDYYDNHTNLMCECGHRRSHHTVSGSQSCNSCSCASFK